MLKRTFFATIAALVVLLGLVIFFLPTPKQDGAVLSGNSFTVKNIRVFDGLNMRENYSLVIKDGIIHAMGEQVDARKFS